MYFTGRLQILKKAKDIRSVKFSWFLTQFVIYFFTFFCLTNERKSPLSHQRKQSYLIKTCRLPYKVCLTPCFMNHKAKLKVYIIWTKSVCFYVCVHTRQTSWGWHDRESVVGDRKSPGDVPKDWKLEPGPTLSWQPSWKSPQPTGRRSPGMLSAWYLHTLVWCLCLDLPATAS